MINNDETTEIYYPVAVLNHDIKSLNNITLKNNSFWEKECKIGKK